MLLLFINLNRKVINMLNTEAIRELMKDKGVKSILQLSRETKIPYTTINYMLKGHDMHVGNLIELSRYFNVPIDDLINKNYGFTVITDDEEIECNTSNIYQATMSTMM